MELDHALIKDDSSETQLCRTTNPTTANKAGIFWFQSFRIFKSGLLKMIVSVKRKNNIPCTIPPLIHECVCIDSTLVEPRKRMRSSRNSNNGDAKIDSDDIAIQETITPQRDSLYYIGSAEINRKKKPRECDDGEASLFKKARVVTAKSKATESNDDLESKETVNIDESLSTSKKDIEENAKTKEGSAEANRKKNAPAVDSRIKGVAPEITITKIKKKMVVEEYFDEEGPVPVDFVSQQTMPLDLGVVTEGKSSVNVEVVTKENLLMKVPIAAKKPMKVLEEGEIDVEEELTTTSQPQEVLCHAISENIRSSFQRSHSNDHVSTLSTDSVVVKEVKENSNKSKKAVKQYTLPRGNYYRQCKKLLDSTLDNLKLDKIPDQINVQDYKAVAYWLFLHESKFMETETTISNIRVAEEIGDEEAYNPLFHTLGCLFLAGKAENVFFKADFLIKVAFGDVKIWKEVFSDVPDAVNTAPPPITAADIYKYEFLVLCNIKFNFNSISKPIKLVRDWSNSLGGKESVLYIKLMEYFENNKHYSMDKKLLEHGETEIALARIIIVLFDGAVNNIVVNKQPGSVTPNDISSSGECIAGSTPTTESASSSTPTTEGAVATASSDPLQLNINPALGLTMTDVISMFLDIEPQFPGGNKEKLHNLLKTYLNYKSPANMRGICNVGRYFLKNFKKYKDILGVKRPKLDKKLGTRMLASKPLPSTDTKGDQSLPVLKQGIASDKLAPIYVKISQLSSKLLDTDLIKHFAMRGCSVEHAIVDTVGHVGTVIFSGNNCIATLTKVVNETHVIRGFVLYEALICPDRANSVELVKSTCHMKIIIKNLPSSCKDDVLFYHFDKLAKVSYIDAQKGSVWFADSIIPSMAKEILYKDQLLANHMNFKLQIEMDPDSSIFVENGEIGPLAIQCRKKSPSDPLKVEDLVAYFRAINDRVLLEHAGVDEYVLLFDSNLSPCEVRKVIQNHIICHCEVVVALCGKSSIFFDSTNSKVLRYGSTSHVPAITTTSPYVSGYGNSIVSHPQVSGYGNSIVSHPQVSGYGNSIVSHPQVSGYGSSIVSHPQVSGYGSSIVSHPQVSGYGNSTISTTTPVHPSNVDSIRVTPSEYSVIADVNTASTSSYSGKEEANRVKDENLLFLGHVTHGLTEDDIRSYFSSYGQLVRVFIHPEKRFGKIEFSATFSQLKEILHAGHVTINGKDINDIRHNVQPYCVEFLETKSCQYGDRCKYFHGPRDRPRGLHDANSRGVGNNGVFDDAKQRDWYGNSYDESSRGVGNNSAFDDRKYTKPICFEFRDNKSCKFGDTCKYVHEGIHDSRRDSFGISRDSLDGGVIEKTGLNETVIFIGNVPLDVSIDDLRLYFNKYGSVVNAYVDKKHFGFVYFQPKLSHHALQEVLNDYHTVRGQHLRDIQLKKSNTYDNRDKYHDSNAHDDLRHMITKKDAIPSSNDRHELFIVFVPSYINQDDLIGYFSQYAEVARVNIHPNKRFAFVTFQTMSSEAFNKIIYEVENSPNEVRGYKLHVKRQEEGQSKYARDESYHHSRYSLDNTNSVRYEHQNDFFKHYGQQKQPHIHNNTNTSRRSSW